MIAMPGLALSHHSCEYAGEQGSEGEGERVKIGHPGPKDWSTCGGRSNVEIMNASAG